VSDKIAIIYNKPVLGKYHEIGEGVAVEDVLDSVTSVEEALDNLGYDHSSIPLCPPMESVQKELTKIDGDIVFNLFEGFDGCEGSEAAVARTLEKLDFCFTGASSANLLICEDKSKTKQVLKACGIPTPDWQVLSPETYKDFNLKFPCIVKPLGEHASHGLSDKSVVWNVTALKEQMEFIWKVYNRLSLVEEFLSGREFRILIVGNEQPRLYPIEEIIYELPANKPKLLTFSAKWIPEDEYYINSYEDCPAKIEPEIRQRIEHIARQAYSSLNCCGYASMDFRESENGQIMVIDVNPNTDVYCGGGIQLPLEVAGIEYAAFIDQILNTARYQFEKRQSSEKDEPITLSNIFSGY
jgi:D-alanine-D-alanine ligase